MFDTKKNSSRKIKFRLRTTSAKFYPFLGKRRTEYDSLSRVSTGGIRSNRRRSSSQSPFFNPGQFRSPFDIFREFFGDPFKVIYFQKKTNNIPILGFHERRAIIQVFHVFR